MDIRKKFLDYFSKHQHEVVESSSLIPFGDATLLFTNAGMNQFKDVFLGKESRDYTKAATSQKCVRAGGKHNDLENVGYTARHHTFFEMLGNFSFGDYFKDEAIVLAWNFVTKELLLDQNRLYVTVFEEDDEAFNIWKNKIGIDPKRIFRSGEKDNFWAMGDTGPCGPCSEIFYDQNPSGELPNYQEFIEQDDRFMEIWNLVFMQFMLYPDGRREKLPTPSIDTGMGLERITSVMEGKKNNYDSSLFEPILKKISEISKKDYFTTADDKIKISQRVIADHIRAMVFLICDGVLPSKEGRGYVLRRIMRRAMRHARKIDVEKNGLSLLAPTVITQYQNAYPTLSSNQKRIIETIEKEESLFSLTVDRGLQLLTQEIEKLIRQNQHTLSGSVAFHLYDTYGFPVDMTADVLREQNMQVDMDGFHQAFSEHREKARGSWKGNQHAVLENFVSAWKANNIQTTFLGYKTLEAKGVVLSMIQNGKEIQSAGESDEISILLDQTPFYGESGGQVGDVGSMTWNGGSLEVLNTHKIGQDYIVHDVKIEQGVLSLGTDLVATVDAELRSATAKNHSATHILHATLKEVLGSHIEQKGSLVAPERLRFDFTHSSAVGQEELDQIENIINQRIEKNDAMITEVLPIDEAKKSGAVSLFGEKYGDVVRVLSLGDYSKEFCGGTHVTQSGDIQKFIFLKESSVSAGVRRVEAITGKRAIQYLSTLEQITDRLCKTYKLSMYQIIPFAHWLIDAQSSMKKSKPIAPQDDFNQYQHEAWTPKIVTRSLSGIFGVPTDKIEERMATMYQKIKQYKQGEQTTTRAQTSMQNVQSKDGVDYVVQKVEIQDPKELRDIADRFLEKVQNGLIILGATYEGKAYLVVKVSKGLNDKYHAGEMVKVGAQVLEGSGGGRPDFAQAGGTKVEALDQALQTIVEGL
ncbi:MAG: alanine--tRNA ligase [Bdellovibrionales bacterium]|nr:alanine--tRNA ligase [Bdellovibrionales bacterium]